VGYGNYTQMATQVKWLSTSQITASINVGTPRVLGSWR